ncbi:major facilitator superfamily domain-containing protein [Trichophaea hybrida]|nr:major facilitator superfamily domain-containing protein [Trichophaea hybrida]
MARSSTSSYAASSHSEKDIENGTVLADIAPACKGGGTSCYDEAIVRVTSTEVDDPEKNERERYNVLSVTKTLSKTRTTRTTADLEAVLGTPFEVRWDEGDPEYPMNWSLAKRGWILMVVSMQTLVVIFYSTSYVSGSAGMVEEFDIKPTTLILGMTTYLIGLGCGPMLLAPLSELYGRRIVYLVSLCLFFLFVIPACIATNFTTILVVRFFGAFAGSVTLSNAPGTLGDIFLEDRRTLAFTPMNGPVLGPIIGGFVYQTLGWRWNNWLVLIMAGIFGLLALTHPETYMPVLLRRRAEKKRRETGDERYMSRFCYKDGEGDVLGLIVLNLKRPVIMLFTEPMCIFWSIYVAAIYGILYLCFTAYPVVFSEIRGWGPGTSGLAFLGIGCGTVLAVASEPLSRKIYNMHSIDPETGKRPPEARILVVCVASVMIPVSMLWFAWTCVPTRIHWIFPILSGIPYGLGNTYVFLHANNYLVISYDLFSASALAGGTITRSILGGVMPLFGPLMYHRLGPNLAATLVAILAAVLVPIPFAFYKWGKIIRMRSPMLQKLQKEKAERGEE